MKRYSAVLVILALLSACSSERGKQTVSTAGMGAALGVFGGPIGVAVGGVLGAAAGVVMPVGSLASAQAKNDL